MRKRIRLTAVSDLGTQGFLMFQKLPGQDAAGELCLVTLFQLGTTLPNSKVILIRNKVIDEIILIGLMTRAIPLSLRLQRFQIACLASEFGSYLALLGVRLDLAWALDNYFGELAL